MHVVADVVDEWKVYCHDPGTLQWRRLPKLRKLHLVCIGQNYLPRAVWDSLIRCTSLDCISVNASFAFRKWCVELTRGFTRLVEPGERDSDWVVPPNVRNMLNHNRRQRMIEFMSEFNLLPDAYHDLSMSKSILYLLIQANSSSFRE